MRVVDEPKRQDRVQDRLDRRRRRLRIDRRNAHLPRHLRVGELIES
jgi:hypothetical protein